MGNERHTKKLFLLGQRLLRLSEKINANDRRFYVCGDDQAPKEIEKDPWHLEARPRLIERAISPEPYRRVALVCDAGLGKTTNMQWLQAQLADGGRQVPLLLSLHTLHDLVELLVKEHSEPETLLRYLANEIARVPGNSSSVERHLSALSRYREQGRITLLIDGLDHAISRGNMPLILSRLLNTRWQKCPVWISGRPYAFKQSWPLFEDPAWRFLRVESLQPRDVQFYLSEQVEPDKDQRSGINWYKTTPEEGRHLLAIPRFLHLVTGILEREVSAAKAQKRDPRRAVEALNLRTEADVYHLAYFEPGEYVAPKDRKPGEDERLNRRGLIAQGLDVYLTLDNGKTKYLGLEEGDIPDDSNYRERIKFVGALLGAIAFEMYANPDQHLAEDADEEKDSEGLEPNTAGVPLDKMNGFRKEVMKRLCAAGQFSGGSVANEFSLLGKMNNSTVDFLLFHELDEQGLVWHDRTVQAFFAAHWAMKYGSPEDRQLLKRRMVDAEGKALDGFTDFWTFAAELPDALVNKARWLEVFAPCYAPPQQVTGSEAWVQWQRRMIYRSFARMQKRSPQTISQWRSAFAALAKGTVKQQRIHQEIAGEDVFRSIPEGICAYGADPLEEQPGIDRLVGALWLHQWQVTNEMYEEFDPEHRNRRWSGNHPLAKVREGGDDRCPVVNVTWYDAWCFAAWCGCRLPTELEWEHACRAGSAESWCSGNDEAELKKYAWYDEVYSKGSTHPVGELMANANGLFDMHGNVEEWCEDRDLSGACARVLRGGSWINYGRICRSANCDWNEANNRSLRHGFRLSKPPP